MRRAHALRHSLLVGLLLLTLAPVADVAGRAARAPLPAPPHQTTPDAEPPPPPPVTAGELRLALAQPVVQPGVSVALTATLVAGSTDLPAGLTLLFSLPPGLATPGPLAYPLPPLPAGQEFAASLPLTADASLTSSQVLTLTASLTGAHLPPQTASTLLGVTPPADSPPTATLDADGAVLQDPSRRLSLLLTPAMADQGVSFSYTELFRWHDAPPPDPGQAAAADAAGDASPPPPHSLFLPQLTAAASLEEDSVPTTPPGANPVTATARRGRPALLQQNGLHFFWLWQLDAHQQGQPVSHFRQPVQLVLSLADLVAQGENPATFQLWSRPHPRSRWLPLPAAYDPATHLLSAWLPHFSQFGLGAGLEPSGDLLPSVKAFSVDLLNGGASLHIPLDSPPGLGALHPGLAFAYSSITLDDLARTAGDWEVQVQASSLGLGWHLAGLSYIARTDNRLDDDTPTERKEFALVLHGQRVGLQFVDGQWRTNPELFARVTWHGGRSGEAHDFGGWSVTTADGRTYDFGDPPASFANAFDPASATATFLARTDGGRTLRVARRWYLRQLSDPLGNQLSYAYRGEQGWERACVSDAWEEENRHWYSRDISPSQVLWSANPSHGMAPKLRILFAYQPSERGDQRLKGSAQDDCLQPFYGAFNQLAAASVQAFANGAWQTLHSYHLEQGYRSFRQPDHTTQTRLHLDALEVRGRSGGLVQRYSFTYDFLAPNRILLRTADNGLGGKLSYAYSAHRTSCSNGTCPFSKLRHAVTQTITENGLGDWLRHDRYYGPPDGAGGEWSAVADDGGFLGFREVHTHDFDTNSHSLLLRRQVLTGYGSGADATRANPDPRRGQLFQHSVWDGAGTLLASTRYDWEAYRWQNGAWNEANPTSRSWERVNDEAVYPITWLRLEEVSASVGSALNESRFFYQASRQNGLQAGNLTELQEWADGLLRRTTITDFFPNPAAQLLTLPARVRVFDEHDACRREQRTVYDNVANGFRTAPARGLVAKVELARAACSEAATLAAYDAAWQVSHFAYDSFGNLTQERQLGGASDGSQDVTTLSELDPTYRLFVVRRWSGQLPTFQATASYFGVNESRIGLGDGRAFWGRTSEVCAVNGVCTRQSYDQFGRRLRRWDGVVQGSPWGSDASAALFWDYRRPYEWGLGPKTSVVNEWRAPRCAGNFVRRHYDGLGNLVLEQRPAELWEAVVDGCGAAPRLDEVDVAYAYDGLGRVSRVSAPRRVSSAWDGNDPNIWFRRERVWSQGASRTSFDALGRVVSQTAANGSQRLTSYSGRTRSEVAVGRHGEGDKMVGWQAEDGLGRLSALRSYRPNGSGWTLAAEVRLRHDAVGNLVRVEPAAGGLSELSYDLAGRQVAMHDVDLGQWRYAYDRLGRLLRQTDGRGQTQCLAYDSLGRLLGKDFNQGTATGCPAALTYELSYSYDAGHSATNRSRGQVTQVRYADGRYRQDLVYDGTGQLARTTVTIAGAPSAYSTAYGYDAYRRPQSTTYPDGEVVRVAYNSLGLPVSLTSSTGELLADRASYDEAGRLTSLRYPAGGALWRTQAYAPFGQQSVDGGRLTALRVGTSQGAGNRLALTYSYDSFGNVKTLSEAVNGSAPASHSFSYDYADRLTAAFGRSYAYDGSGRLTQYEGASHSVSGSFPRHAVKNAGYSYDGAGNLVRRFEPSSGQWQRLVWDGENRLAAVRNDAGSATLESYVYAPTGHPGGQRVKQVSAAGATYYPFPHYEVSVTPATLAAAGCAPGEPACPTDVADEQTEAAAGHALFLPHLAASQAAGAEPGELQASAAAATTVTKYYFFGSQRIAMRRGGALTYLHADALGSTVLTTQGSATVEQRYFAYGRTRTGGPLPTDRTFTGQQADATGLLYYHARYYDPHIGRFLSPDTLVPDPANLQDYNRFAYARSNPLKYNDPSGHCPVCVVVIAAAVMIGIEGSVAESPVGNYTDVPDNANGKLAVSLIGGDVSDVVTVVAGHDYISQHEVPHFSREWWGTAAMAFLPVMSGSALRVIDHASHAIRAADDAVVPAARFLDDYSPGAAFSGVFDPGTGNLLVRPSGDTLLKTGEVPFNRVDRYGGHGILNQELAQELGEGELHKTLGFTVFYDAPGELSVNWNSGSVNLANYYVRAVPDEYRPMIMDSIRAVTGFNVTTR